MSHRWGRNTSAFAFAIAIPYAITCMAWKLHLTPAGEER